MTVEQALNAYMPKRRELFQQRVPVTGWLVEISPKDAFDLELEITGPVDGVLYIYGARWEINHEVPEGILRLTAGGRTYDLPCS